MELLAKIYLIWTFFLRILEKKQDQFLSKKFDFLNNFRVRVKLLKDQIKNFFLYHLKKQDSYLSSILKIKFWLISLKHFFLEHSKKRN